MKWFVWLLLLLNVAIFGYFKLNETYPVDIVIGHEALHPEQLRILTEQDLASLPAKAVSAPPVVPMPLPQNNEFACYEWGSFSGANISRARNILEKFSVGSELKKAESQEAKRFWVYIPPRKNMEEALSRDSELRNLGIQESFVVQEPQWRYAISLGVFKDESLANKLLDDLHAKGVKSAIKGVRNHENDQSNFLLKHVENSVADEIVKLQPDFPGSELKKVTCP